jgi:hypothetical protein
VKADGDPNGGCIEYIPTSKAQKAADARAQRVSACKPGLPLGMERPGPSVIDANEGRSIEPTTKPANPCGLRAKGGGRHRFRTYDLLNVTPLRPAAPRHTVSNGNLCDAVSRRSSALALRPRSTLLALRCSTGCSTRHPSAVKGRTHPLTPAANSLGTETIELSPLFPGEALAWAAGCMG